MPSGPLRDLSRNGPSGSLKLWIASVPDIDKDESGHNLLRELHLSLSGCNSQGFLGRINPVWERNGNFYTTESKRREEYPGYGI